MQWYWKAIIIGGVFFLTWRFIKAWKEHATRIEKEIEKLKQNNGEIILKVWFIKPEAYSVKVITDFFGNRIEGPFFPLLNSEGKESGESIRVDADKVVYNFLKEGDKPRVVLLKYFKGKRIKVDKFALI